MANTKNNTGAIFVNTKATTDKHPQFTGDAIIDGVIYDLAGWRKTGTEGKKDWISLSFKAREDKDQGSGKKSGKTAAKDDLSF